MDALYRRLRADRAALAAWILCVVGTRPEAVKMAPVILALEAHPVFEPVVCSTGQHRELLDQMLQFFDIEPDIDLALMRPDQRPEDRSQRQCLPWGR